MEDVKFIIYNKVSKENEYFRADEDWKVEEAIKDELYFSLKENFNNYIDETNQVVEIMGISFNPSRILEELDPIAWKCYYNDFIDYKTKEKIEELERYNQIELSNIAVIRKGGE